MDKGFEKLDAILDSDKIIVRQNLGEPKNGGEEIDIYRIKENALVIFYQWKNGQEKAEALILYGSSGEVLYAKNIRLISRETYQFLSNIVCGREAESSQDFSVEKLEKLCGTPAVIHGSGIDVWFYGTDFGRLISFQALSGKITRMDILNCLE